MIQSTIELYSDVARDAVQGLSRSAWALLALLVITPIVAIAATIVAPLGILGGFLISLVQALGIGWYLSLVEITVNGTRRVRPSDLKDNVGQYVWDVISVLFIFFIAQMLLGALLPAPAMAALVIVATILFNPAPEMIYQDRASGAALLGDAAKFMQTNWPEWLVPHVLAALFLGSWGLVTGGGGFSLTEGLGLVQMFGPWFGFVSPGAITLSLARGGLVGLVLGAVMLVFVHGFMLFRGHLYRRLRGTSRRGRAWQARVR